LLDDDDDDDPPISPWRRLASRQVNALLSILMADLTSGMTGFLLSTIIIVIFGEIIPQASCSRYALVIGSFAVPLVKVGAVGRWSYFLLSSFLFFSLLLFS
jgi:CBS domain containing-hemolysin-like protein